MTGNFRKLVISSMLLGSSLCSYSATVTLDDAFVIAKDFYNARYKGAGSPRLEAVMTGGTKNKPLYYVFNATGGAGFVIVSAEDVTTPVLGYSFEGSYPVIAQPDAMKWMMSGLENDLKVAPEVQQAPARTSSRAEAEKKELSTAAWSQEGPFNSMIPGKPLVGCVGTAMATIMKYHQWPEAGNGSFDGVDFNVKYDWSSMRSDNYRSGYTQAEGDAVAALMYHASKSIDTRYDMSGSSAYEVRVPAALSTYFGYDPGVSYKKRSEVASQADWDKIVKDEIDAGRPVLYCGQDVTAGHAFVCDGYDGEFLHFNWGWGGAGNGYFRSTALNPTVSRTHSYNNLNTIIYNIKPSTSAIAVWSPIHITADGNQVGIGSDMTDLASGKSFKVRVGNLKNLSYTDFSGKIAVALCDASGKMKALLSSPSNFSLPSMATLYDGTIEMKNCQLPSGTEVASTDRVRIMTQEGGVGEWLPVAGELPTVNELAVKVANPASFPVVLPADVAGVNVEGNKNVIFGWDYTFKASAQNPGEDVITVKANGYVLTPADGGVYTIKNVREPQTISILVQKAADVIEKRSIWVETPGTLASLISEEESGSIKELTLFGSINAADFTFMRNSMRLTRLDLSGVYIAAHGSDQANAIPREAFRGLGSLREVVLPSSVNRLNNGCFRQAGITTITIPAGVKTYEYNIFVGATNLRDIYVGRETAEFINWCVLSGVKTSLVTLHVPSERAVANYSKAENWNTIANIIVDQAPVATDLLFAVMDNAEVKFDCQTATGKVAKGTPVSFSATHIGDNDNSMKVYANSTLLSPDNEGLYHATVDANTIIHFDLVPPIEVLNPSQWKLTDKNGSVGLFTDAVNVIKGQEFTIRANALNIPAGYDQFFWAAALTDANGNIKEFISPVTVWTAGAADNHKFNVVCRVNDSEVREGNTIRLVTSPNKKQWFPVAGATEEITDAIPALNNMTQVYNINVAEVSGVTVSGVPTTAVRGRDFTMKVVPSSAAHRVDLYLNGDTIVTNAASINQTFVAMADMDFGINVYDPKEVGSVTYNVKSGELYKAVTAASVCAHVIVTGETYASDLSAAFTQSFAQKTIKKLDLSGLTIIADPTNGDNVANMLPSQMFYKSSGIGQSVPVLEEILLPNSVERIAEGAFTNCANIKEITLPESLKSTRIEVGKYASGSIKYGFAIGRQAFQGCTSLAVIRIPGTPETVNGRMVVAHHDPYGVYRPEVMSSSLYNLGHADAKKVTVIVPEEYLSVYKTHDERDAYTSNPWEGHGYNILSETPVYGANFDPSRISVADGVDVTALASFLGDNVSLSEMKVDGKLKLTNPSIKSRVYDNGTLIEPAADGSLSLTFINPAKNVNGAGNHELKVIYTHEVAFESTSPLFTISEPEVDNEAGNKFETFDKTNPLAPVLRDVAENSSVRFRVGFASEHSEGLEARVMSGQQELTADEEGYYNVDIVNAGKEIRIFAVPTDGATLNASELAAIDPDESSAITSIALTGKIPAKQLDEALKSFKNLERLDLSDFEGELPAETFKDMTELTTIALPKVQEISAGMFEGCTSLESVDIPATVYIIGNGAFKDCRSLETIRLTGISSIGAGAFEGCDNLTTITLLAATAEVAPASRSISRSRASRGSEGIDPEAFAGLNPNCIIVLDNGVTVPSTAGNFLTTSTGTVTEELPDGTTSTREGRIYAAAGNMNFVSGYPLAIPHAFTLADNASVTFEAEGSDWTGIVVPFDVATVTDASGKTVTFTTPEADATVAEGNLLYTLPAAGETLSSVTAIQANVPYLMHIDGDDKVIMKAKGIRVPATPEVISVEGKEFSLNVTTRATERRAAETYLLNSTGTAFVPAGEEDETVNLEPSTLYATSPVTVSEIAVNLPRTGSYSGIENVEYDGVELNIVREGNSLVIYSPDARTETIYNLDGTIARTVRLIPGRNTVQIPAQGVYIIASRKFTF